MKKYTKILFLTLATLTLTNHQIVASAHQQALKKAQEQYQNQLAQLGRDRVFTIMYDGDHGINQYNKKITYAQTANLVQDLVIPKMTLYFPTKTDFGQTFLVENLSMPISPKDTSKTVHLRQQAIKHLYNKPEVKQEIDQALEQVKQAQETVMKLMINREQVLEKIRIPDLSHWGMLEPVVKPWYSIDKYLRTNGWVNTAGLVATTGAAATFLSSAGINAYRGVQNLASTPDTPQEELSSLSGKLIWNGFGTISGLSYGTIFAKSIYNEYQRGIENRNLIHALHQIVIAAKKIEKLCKEHGIATQFKPSHITDKKGLAMIEGLLHPRYSETESSIVATPWVNTFITEIYEQDIYLAPFFALIAEIDAYNAIATRMVETQNQPNSFCFAQFLHNKKTTLQADGFWNIIIPNAVANSLNEDRSIIFTGANAGGKSTAMRSILQNIVLAQTFGIATGKSFALTPYDVIHSYLHIIDDPEKGLSRYASELQHANDIVHQAKTLAPDEKYFFIIDELFTGTGGKEGQTLAFEFINEDLAPYLEKTQFIFATHFDQLKEIESSNPQQFANYKINPPTLTPQGKLKYPFTISKGANNVNIAALLKKEAGLLGKAGNTNN